MTLARLSWTETRARLRSDRERLRALRAQLAPYPSKGEFCSAAFMSVLLYRLSNHLYRANHRWSARVIWHLNVLLTGADISEPADIGSGFVVLHPPGISIMGRAGRNLTVMACCGIGGEVGRQDDVSGWPGTPLLGDDIIMEPHSGIIGPVTIGSRVRVCSGAMVSRDVPADSVVEGPRVKILRRPAESGKE
jgi:serine O-acetyltransferase